MEKRKLSIGSVTFKKDGMWHDPYGDARVELLRRFFLGTLPENIEAWGDQYQSRFQRKLNREDIYWETAGSSVTG